MRFIKDFMMFYAGDIGLTKSIRLSLYLRKVRAIHAIKKIDRDLLVS